MAPLRVIFGGLVSQIERGLLAQFRLLGRALIAPRVSRSVARFAVCVTRQITVGSKQSVLTLRFLVCLGSVSGLICLARKPLELSFLLPCDFAGFGSFFSVFAIGRDVAVIDLREDPLVCLVGYSRRFGLCLRFGVLLYSFGVPSARSG